MLITIIIFLIVLSVLVLVHELGHFLTARKFGIRSEEFGLGFPPRLLGFYKTNEGKWKLIRGNKTIDPESYKGTIYSLNYVPMGGFVKIKGENGENLAEDSFAHKKIWQRAIVLSAGVTMNIVLAAVLFTACFMVGTSQSLEGVDPGAQISDRKLQIVEVQKSSPAEKAGILAGDVLVGINDQTFVNYKDLKDYTNKNVGKELKYAIKRNNEQKNFKIKPQASPANAKEAIVGIGIAETGVVKYPWYSAPWQGIRQTLFASWAILMAFYELIKNIFVGAGVSADVSGPIGIAAMTGHVARMGFVYLLQFTALLSINLAIINFLPIPALDGGRVFFLIIEKIKGRPMRHEVENLVNTVSFALLMLLVVVVTFRDVFRFSGKFLSLWHNFF